MRAREKVCRVWKDKGAREKGKRERDVAVGGGERVREEEEFEFGRFGGKARVEGLFLLIDYFDSLSNCVGSGNARMRIWPLRMQL